MLPAAVGPVRQEDSQASALVAVAPACPSAAAALPGARPAPLWLATHLPRFAGEVGLAGLAPDTPAVLVTATGRSARVLLPNAPAARAGITAGASLAMASALAGSALVVRRQDAVAQAGVLAALGDLAWQWTPVVAIFPPDGLLLEVGGSLRLFGGLEALCEAVRAALGAAGHVATLASAPNAQGAWLLALAGREARVPRQIDLPAALRRLPLASLRVPAPSDRLEGMGLREFGQLLRLPRHGLTERFGPALLDWMDRALGRYPEVLALHTPAEHYRQRLEFLEELHALPRLLALAARQIVGLCGWLAARGLGLLTVQWRLLHAGEADTRLLLGLLEPSRDPGHITALLQERWRSLALPGPVRALEIELRQSRPLTGRSQTLFHTAPGGTSAGAPAHCHAGLVELLRARLGAGAVRGLAFTAEQRPEQAWQMVEPGQVVTPATDPVRPRPLWLLPEPLPLEVQSGLPWFAGALAPLGGGERIEGGWWEGAQIARDYHLAARADGLRCWIFRDLRADERWYLHGIFA